MPAPTPASDYADAALLVLCSELQVLQAEWQVLWTAAREADDTDTSARHRLAEFSDTIWPGYFATPAQDRAARLLTMPATTLDGFQAKAAVIRALCDAGTYCRHSRQDESLLVAAFLRDVAGRFFVPLGADAPQADEITDGLRG